MACGHSGSPSAPISHRFPCTQHAPHGTDHSRRTHHTAAHSWVFLHPAPQPGPHHPASLTCGTAPYFLTNISFSVELPRYSVLLRMERLSCPINASVYPPSHMNSSGLRTAISILAPSLSKEHPGPRKHPVHSESLGLAQCLAQSRDPKIAR